MDDYYLPNCCYDYRYDKYEDGIMQQDDYAELEDRMYEENLEED